MECLRFTNGPCRYQEECYSDRHHKFWPKDAYQDKGVKSIFRELPENQEKLPRCVHMLKHATEQPPEMPPRATMVYAIVRALVDRKINLSNTKLRHLGIARHAIGRLVLQEDRLLCILNTSGTEVA